jgi:hypothetical protein
MAIDWGIRFLLPFNNFWQRSLCPLRSSVPLCWPIEFVVVQLEVSIGSKTPPKYESICSQSQHVVSDSIFDERSNFLKLEFNLHKE